jgi:thioredoxin-like negative regulator of GroEL
MYKGHVILAKLNVDEFPELMTRLGITAIPWVVLFKDGKQMDKPRIGYKTDVDVANYIREKLKLSIFDALRPK